MPLKEQEGLDSFLNLCQKTKSDQLLLEVFICFLTHDELESLGARTKLIAELLKGELTQREISAQLNISIAKITRGSNMLKQIDSNVLEYLKEQLIES